MRAVLFSCLTIATVMAHAQTATSVQDGQWNDATTWDCNCIPTTIDVVVDHTVEITTNIILFMQQVQVNASGIITMDGPHSVAITETVTNDGQMHLIGDIDVDGELLNNGAITIEGDLHNDNVVFMGGPNTSLRILGNFGNGGSVDGEGLICISDITQNSGTISGHVDYCDGSPTVVDPPFIDINTGTVANTVVFCAKGGCTVQVEGTQDLSWRLFPDPATDEIQVQVPSIPAKVLLFDALGRKVEAPMTWTDRLVRIDLTGLAPGRYVVRIAGQAHPWIAPFVLIR